MKHDVLREATLELREEADASKGRAEETRARVLATLKERRSRKLAAIRVMIPIAAVLVGSAAWASATHRLPGAWYEWKQSLGLTDDAEPPPPPPESRGPADPMPTPAMTTAPVIETPSEPLADAPAPKVAVQTVGGQKIAAPSPSRPAPAPSEVDEPAANVESKAPAAAPPVDPSEALYRKAHEAHFVTRNPSAALSAWDAYLAAAPSGRFALEAHYNRALCLVRLGRKADAERALGPFADGAFGGYRKAEARSLLDAMRGGSK